MSVLESATGKTGSWMSVLGSATGLLPEIVGICREYLGEMKYELNWAEVDKMPERNMISQEEKLFVKCVRSAGFANSPFIYTPRGLTMDRSKTVITQKNIQCELEREIGPIASIFSESSRFQQLLDQTIQLQILRPIGIIPRADI